MQLLGRVAKTYVYPPTFHIWGSPPLLAPIFYASDTKSIQNYVPMFEIYPETSGSPNATTTSTQQRYGEKLRQQREHRQDHKSKHLIEVSTTHPRLQEEADSLCDSFSQRCSPELTNNIVTNMVPERVRTITTTAYDAVDTDQEITLSEIEDVLHRLNDTAPGNNTVCYSMIKNTPLTTRHLFLRLINQSFTEGRLPTRWKMTKIIPIPKKDNTHRPISPIPFFRKSWNDLC